MVDKMVWFSTTERDRNTEGELDVLVGLDLDDFASAKLYKSDFRW